MLVIRKLEMVSLLLRATMQKKTQKIKVVSFDRIGAEWLQANSLVKSGDKFSFVFFETKSTRATRSQRIGRKPSSAIAATFEIKL